MTDITPKRRPEALTEFQRGYVIHSRPWPDIVARFQQSERFKTMLHLVESLAASPASSELFATTSMWDIWISDSEDFRLCDSTLRVSYYFVERKFEFWHCTFSGHDDRKTCSESEALQTLRLFLRLKFGVLYDPVA